MIQVKKTYCLVRAIRFYATVDHSMRSPVCVNSGPSILLPSGTMVCVAVKSLESNSRAMMTTPVRSMGAVYGWVDESDLVAKENAESEGLQPCFV